MKITNLLNFGLSLFHPVRRVLILAVLLCHCFCAVSQGVAVSDKVAIYTIHDSAGYTSFYVSKSQVDKLAAWVPGKGAMQPPVNDFAEKAIKVAREKHGPDVVISLDEIEFFNLNHTASGKSEYLAKLDKGNKWGVRVRVTVDYKEPGKDMVFETVVFLLSGEMARPDKASPLFR
jgi:hypothetical protein